ncbi:MAG: hypothetical protein ACOYEQ_02975 [Bacillota bacterium]
MKREGPIALTILVGVVYIISVMFAAPVLEATQKTLDDWYTIVTGFICLVGVVSLTQVHGSRIVQKRNDWFYSGVVLFSLYGYMLLGLFGGVENALFNLLYNNVLSVILMTIFSTLTFWIGSAAYRAFRAKSLESAILLISAALVMLGKVTLGNFISPVLPKAANWIMNVPNTAGMRAIEMGSAIGGIVLALRIILGIERNFVGSD